MKQRRLKAVPTAETDAQAAQNPAAAPSQTQVLIFCFTPAEADVVFQALGELPAKHSETVRGKIKAQAEQQAALLKGLFAEPSVQAVVSA